MPKRLRLRCDIPYYLESRLVQKYGYAVQERVYKDSIIFVRREKPDVPVTQGVQDGSGKVVYLPTVVKPASQTTGIPMLRQAELMRRCDNIVDFFPDPYNQTKAIRQRLHNVAQTLVAPEAQFILEYMDDNFPLTDNGD